jgi:hypothetical protein
MVFTQPQMKMLNYVTMVNSKSTLEWDTVILRSPQAYDTSNKYSQFTVNVNIETHDIQIN